MSTPKAEFKPGDRVTWAEMHPLDVDEPGIVQEPTSEDRAYFQEQGYPTSRCVLVAWRNNDWDSAWRDPTELRLIEEAV